MTTELVTIPSTIEDAITGLETELQDMQRLAMLLTAKQWYRAAIVYAFTTEGRGQGKRSDLGDKSPKTPPYSFREFAALGVTGLTSHRQVARYHRAWVAAIEAGFAQAVTPGSTYGVPELEWPPPAHAQIEKGDEDGADVPKVPWAGSLRLMSVSESLEQDEKNIHDEAMAVTTAELTDEERMAMLKDVDVLTDQLHALLTVLGELADAIDPDGSLRLRRHQADEEGEGN